MKSSQNPDVGPSGTYNDASELGWNSLRKRKTMIERVFLFNLQLYKVEERVCNFVFTKSFLTVYFLITGVSITEWGFLHNKYFENFDIPFDNGLRLLITGFYVVLITMLVAGVFRPLKFNSKPTLFDHLVVWGKFLHIYVVLPICFWLYSGELFDWGNMRTGVNKLQLAFTWASLIVGLALNLGFSSIRNLLPSGSKAACLHKYGEFSVNTFFLLLIAVCKNLSGTSAEMAWDLTSIIVSGLCAIFYTTIQTFWYYSVNTWYICGHMSIFAIRIAMRLLTAGDSHPNLLEVCVYASITFVLVVKSVNNFCEMLLDSSLLKTKEAGPVEILDTLFQYNLIQQTHELQPNHPEVSPSLLFKFSLIGELLKKNKHFGFGRKSSYFVQKQTTDLESGVSPPVDHLFQLQEIIVSTRAITPESLYIQLILQILFIEQNLLKFSLNLAAYRKAVAGSSWGLLTYYLLEALIRGRLTTLSNSTIQASANSKTNVFSEIFRELSGNSSAMAAEKFRQNAALRNSVDKSRNKSQFQVGNWIDLEQVFWCNQEYLKCVCGINQFITVKTNLFAALLEKHAVKSSYAYSTNKLAGSLSKHLDAKMKLLAELENAPNYMLATAACYFVKVRHDAEKAEKIFRVYQSRLSRLLHNPSIFGKEITDTNFLYSSVVMKIDVSSDLQLGMIKDITPNYREHLGEPEEGDPTRVNINTLFPGSMASSHAKMMRATNDQPIFNRQREFQINGFDGHLRPLSFVLKLDSAVSGGLHALALLRFPEDGRSRLVLANQKLEVTTAESEFLDLYLDTKSSKLGDQMNPEVGGIHLTFREICPALFVQINFFEFLRTEAPNSDSLIQQKLLLNVSGTDAETVKKDILNYDFKKKKLGESSYSYLRLKQRILEQVEDFEKSGLKHRFKIDQKAASSKEKNVSAFTKVEKSQFDEETYYRIWVTFDLNYNKEARKVKSYQADLAAEQHNLAKAEDQGILQLLKPQLTKDPSASENVITDVENNLDSPQKQTRFGDLALSEQFVPGDSAEMSFEKMLLELKDASPIVSLVSEALGKNYPPEIKAALTWIQDFYKASEAAENKKNDKPTEIMICELDSFKPNYLPVEQGKVESALISAQRTVILDPELHTTFMMAQSLPQENCSLPTANLGVPMKDAGERPSHKLIKLPVAERFAAEEDTASLAGALHKITKKSLQYNKVIPTTTTNLYTGTPKDSTGTTISPKKGSGVLQRNKKSAWYANEAAKRRGGTVVHKDLSRFEVETPDLTNRQKNTMGDTTSREAAKRPMRTDQQFKVMITNNKGNLGTLDRSAKVRAFTSQSKENLRVLNKQLSDFKFVRRADGGGDDDQNPSVSAGSNKTGAGATHFLKSVTNTLETSKSGVAIFFISSWLVLFSVYFCICTQLIFARLINYNYSNTDSYTLVSQFLILDRRIIQGTEIQSIIYVLSEAIVNKNKTRYDLISRSYSRTLPPGTDPIAYIFARLDETQLFVRQAMLMIQQTLIVSIDSKDLTLANQGLYRDTAMKYVDRFVDLSQVYKVWIVPYYTFVYYQVTLIQDNLRIMRSLNAKATSTNFSYNLNSRDMESFLKLRNLRYGRDNSVFAISTLKNVVELFSEVAEELVVRAVDRHFEPIYAIFWLSLAVLGVMLGYTIYSAYKINEIQKDLLSNYSLLRPWEIFGIIEEANKQHAFFCDYIYNEVRSVNEYFEIGLNTYHSLFSRKIIKLQEKFSKEKDKVSGGLRLNKDFYFFSTKFGFMIWGISGLIFAVMAVSIFNFLRVNEKRIGAEMLMFTSHKLLLGVTKNYIAALMMTIYGYHLPIAGQPIESDPFVGTIDEFLIFQIGSRRQFIDYFGPEKSLIIDELAFGDVCGKLALPPVFQKICRTINQESARKGIVGFLQYQKQYLETLRSNVRRDNQNFLEASRNFRPTEPLIQELFSDPFSELRLGNGMVYNTYYTIMNTVVTAVVQEIKEQLDRFVGQIMQYISLGLYLVLLISYFYLFRAQAEELDICYETFKLIDPYFLMSNRYLQHKLKQAFRGVE